MLIIGLMLKFSLEMHVRKTAAYFLLALPLCLLPLISSCASTSLEAGGDSQSPDELIPEQYRNLTNPLDADRALLEAASEDYQPVCASCHGEGGRGDGPAASLDPAPPDFADRSRMSALSDGYLYWRIAEGGSEPPFESTMPAWGSVFDEQQIWQLVAYIRSFSE